MRYTLHKRGTSDIFPIQFHNTEEEEKRFQIHDLYKVTETMHELLRSINWLLRIQCVWKEKQSPTL